MHNPLNIYYLLETFINWGLSSYMCNIAITPYEMKGIHVMFPQSKQHWIYEINLFLFTRILTDIYAKALSSDCYSNITKWLNMRVSLCLVCVKVYTKIDFWYNRFFFAVLGTWDSVFMINITNVLNINSYSLFNWKKVPLQKAIVFILTLN